VVREAELNGRKVYGIQRESAGLPPTLVFLDAETGDVLQTRQTAWSGEAGAIPVTTTYSDYREISGMRVPHSYTSVSEPTGRTIFQGSASRSTSSFRRTPLRSGRYAARSVIHDRFEMLKP
jgi:hypothetical protein